ncbi:hypothetical protein [Streptomyces nigra]
MTGFAWTEEVLARVDKLVPYNAEEKAKERGALCEKATLPFVSYVVTDGNLVTGQNPGSAKATAKKVVESIEGNASKREAESKRSPSMPQGPQMDVAEGRAPRQRRNTGGPQRANPGHESCIVTTSAFSSTSPTQCGSARQSPDQAAGTANRRPRPRLPPS